MVGTNRLLTYYPMNLDDLATRMERSARAVASLVVGVSDAQFRWKADQASWSLLEIINHLCDEEREASLEWLRSLDEPDWNARHASDRRNLRAGDMLASWIAHDLLHIRQIVKTLMGYLEKELESFSSDYAGFW